MLWILTLVLSLAAGWFLAAAAWPARGWTSVVGRLALAVLFGAGAASILVFALILTGAASAGTVWGALVMLAGGSALLWWKSREPVSALPVSDRKFPWAWALTIAFVAGCVLLVLDFQAAAAANPDGEWDASAIWNLRARYLAGGADVWRRSVAAEIGGEMTGAAHPGYPLFLSSFLAMQWIAAGSYTAGAPIATGFLISIAVLALLVASLAARRSTALGLLAGLLLLSTELFASQAASQYSDLLLGLAFLASLVLLDAAALEGKPSFLLAAGLAIGFAPWIKNEGQPFALVAIAVAFWRFRKRAAWLLTGAIPGFAATAVLKFVAEGREAIFPATVGGAIAKIADPTRWLQSAAGFGKGVLDAGPLWAHPVLLAAALAFALRFVPAGEGRARLWLAIPILGTLAAEFGLYLITAAGLAWHISTSVERLLAQAWPSLLWLFFSMLRAPEEYFVQPPEMATVAAARPNPNPTKRKRANA